MKNYLIQKILEIIELNKNTKYKILDFGCGQGHLLNEIRKINKSSELIGIDSSEKSIKIAKDNFKNIDFHQFKFINHFDFNDENFDLILSVDTLECIIDKNALLNELFRILKPDGKVLFAHWDWDTQVYNSKNKNIIRNIVHQFADWEQGWMDTCDGMMGRKLWGYFQHSKKFNGKIEIFNLIETDFIEGQYGFDRLKDINSLVKKGKINQNDYDNIIKEMTNLYSENQYFYSLNSYIYFGEKITQHH